MRTMLKHGACACALITGVLLGVLAPSASALGASPLRITKFTLQPTKATVEKPVEAQLGGTTAQGVEFVNEPYAVPFTQAGGHPWALTTTVEFETEEGTTSSPREGTRDPKDIVVSLPPGLLGNPQAVPRCSLALLTAGNYKCPPDTQVGVYRLAWHAETQILGQIVNVAPEKGQSAEFALVTPAPFDTAILTAHLVRTGKELAGEEGYGFEVASNEIPQVGLAGVELTFWGVPADPSHDPMRGKACSGSFAKEPLKCGEGQGEGGEHAGIAPVPFLTLPSTCTGGPETATIRADSWQEPGEVSEGQYTGYTEAKATLPAATGCGLSQFLSGTGLDLEPDNTLADDPVGLGVNLRVPQNEKPQQSATPLLRQTVVTLPEGMSVSPGVVDGVKACNATGPEGINITGAESEQEAPNGELQLAPGHCPDASVVGEAEVVTPYLPNPVKGHVYLARPGCGGAGEAACTPHDAADGNLYKLYLELGGTGALSDAGIVFKVPLETEANPATGQLTAIAKGLVQAPYSEVKIRLNGGPRAPLDNPAVCGSAVTAGDFTPWSAPGLTPEGLLVGGTPDALSSSFFNVEGCASPAGLTPGFSSGTVSSQAGSFSSFTMNLTRRDREQFLKGVQVHTPPGLLGMLSSVPLCGEPQADAGTCPESSKIGTTRVASGAGSHPFEIGGNVYLTTGYGGAPFGLSIVTDAVAGPFNLGLVVVRAKIAVDPVNSSLTITTDETGPYAIPQIIFGVPLRLKQVTVNIDRPNFMFNPTNCSGQQITASVSGSGEAVANVASPFAAAGCKSLEFKPAFKVSTSGKTSKANGASLDAKVTYPPFKAGSEANIARVKVDLPKQLPSRLTTLQKACTAAQFEADPAGCPAASVVGIVQASTPLLPVGLEGPVYFVSHGGEAFPSLIVVLQGDGVRVDLTGSTFISHAGITSSTFKTVPDVPVNTFELYLPEGKFSALAANGNLCKSKLVMPTEFVAQNGAVMKQSTKVTVTDCPKVKAKAKKARRPRRARRARVAGDAHGNRRVGR